MDLNILTAKWCNLSDNATVVIVTDFNRIALAKEIQSEITNNCRIINIEEQSNYYNELLILASYDLLIALFSFDTYVHNGANQIFSPFSKPKDIVAKYVFIRLSITKESLLEGLSTKEELIYDTIDRLHSYKDNSKLHVTNAAGTDITLSIHSFTTCEHRIQNDGDMAFLPPSETSAEVIPHTANGKIVVDVTVGQLYYYGKFLGQFGLVDEPVTMIVKGGLIDDVKGGYMAKELKDKLFALPEACRVLVELGHGLSKMTPTGLIGVDESIIDTCHFGIGDGGSSGVHLDVVVSNPSIYEDCDPLLPAELAKILSGYICTKNQIGCSMANVYRYQKDDEVFFLKIEKTNNEIFRERDIICWLNGKLPVSTVKYWCEHNGFCYLLMSEAKGHMSYDCSEDIVCEPYEDTVRRLAEGILMLESIDIRDCPFENRLDRKLENALYNIENNLVDLDDFEEDNQFETPMDLYHYLVENKPLEELCFTHGDYCLPNIFIDEHKVTGFIDLGRAGIADKWQDIALCVRSLRHNFQHIEMEKYITLLFEILKMEPDFDKINYYILLDELF